MKPCEFNGRPTAKVPCVKRHVTCTKPLRVIFIADIRSLSPFSFTSGKFRSHHVLVTALWVSNGNRDDDAAPSFGVLPINDLLKPQPTRSRRLSLTSCMFVLP
jgi:hypothetical protein